MSEDEERINKTRYLWQIRKDPITKPLLHCRLMYLLAAAAFADEQYYLSKAYLEYSQRAMALLLRRVHAVLRQTNSGGITLRTMGVINAQNLEIQEAFRQLDEFGPWLRFPLRHY